jgi:uncharacterized protein
MDTGAMENHPELVDELAWIAPLWGNPGDVLERVRSPWELGEALRSAGLLFPETRASDRDLPRDGTWLAKTYRGASGSGVREVGETARQRDKGTRSEPEQSRVYQKWIAGTPGAAVYVAAEGKAELLGVTRQLIGEQWLGGHGFQYCGSIGPLPMSAAALGALMKIGTVVAERFELMGLFGVDFVLNGDEAWVIEVNPRFTASVEIVERFTGVSAIAAHNAACVEMRIAAPGGYTGLRIEECSSHGKAIVFAKRQLTISRAFAEWSLGEALRTPWPTLGDVSPAGTLIEEGRPILTVFAEGAMAGEVESRLRERVASIEGMLYSGSGFERDF